jgi:hypothetical protein
LSAPDRTPSPPAARSADRRGLGEASVAIAGPAAQPWEDRRARSYRLSLTKPPPPPPPPRLRENSENWLSWPRQNTHLLAAFAAVTALAVVIHACTESQNRKQILRAGDRMSKILDNWQSDLQIASATSRIALAGPLMKLREREEELEKLEAPGCLSASKAKLLAYMRAYISSFTSFMSEDESASTEHLLQAAMSMNTFYKLQDQCLRSAGIDKLR